MSNSVYVIGLGTNEKLTSRLIRQVTQSPGSIEVPRWSHTWLEYSHPELGVMRAIHADSEGVRVENVLDVIARYPEHRRIEVRWDLKPGLVRAIDEVGRRYDFDGVILRGLILSVQRWSGCVLWVPEDDLDEWFCSELVTMILAESAFPGHEQMVPHLTTPDKVESILDGSRHVRDFG